MRHILISIPSIDTDQTIEQSKRKMLEAADDYLAEISGVMNNREMLNKMFNLVQSVANYMVHDAQENILKGEASLDYVATMFRFANDRHELKVENQHAQRGMVVAQSEHV